MIKDPGLRWDGEFPYDALAAAGVTPQATQDEVRRASFTLMKKRMMTPGARVAWDELRVTPQRMVADFLLYDLDADAEIAAAIEATRVERDGPDAGTRPVCALSITAELWDEPNPGSLLPADAADGTEDMNAFMAAAFPDWLITFDR
jgi:hypothetical protein